MKILIMALMVLSFSVGFLSSTYKIFPYEQVKHIKDVIVEPKSKINTTYTHKKSFFELLGVGAEVAMIGDSITSSAEWGEVFQGASIANRGISGDTVEGVLNRIDSIISTGAKKAFLMIGINDLIKGREVNGIYSDYAAIVDRLKLAGITPYIQSTLYAGISRQHLNNSVLLLNSKLSKMASDKGLVYIDINDKLSLGMVLSERFTSDDLHLNGEAYVVWRDIISRHIT